MNDYELSDGITVYGKPNCPRCKAATNSLDKAEVPYQYVDLSEDPDALAFVKRLGYKAAPVTIVVREGKIVGEFGQFPGIYELLMLGKRY